MPCAVRPQEFRVLPELQVSDIIPHCLPSMPAVCRIPGRGAACLVSVVETDRTDYGVLLTTIFAVGSRQQASNLTVLFHEGDKMRKVVECRLRPDLLFYSPPAPPGMEAADTNRILSDDWMPYCIVACELTGERGGTIKDITPVTLPATTDMLETVRADAQAVHLAAEHPTTSKERKWVLSRLDSRSSHIHRYSVSAVVSGYFSTGDPIFDEAGRLVAVNHHTRNYVQGLPIHSIIWHLFDHNQMGEISHHILEQDPELADHLGPDGQPLPRPAGIFYKHVWATWHHNDDLATLVHLLHAFRYSPPLMTLALERMTDHINRGKLEGMAELKGLWPVLDALERHPFDKELLCAAAAVVGEASCYETNRAALTHLAAIPALLARLDRAEADERVLQWSVLLFANLCIASEENRALLLALGGFAHATNAMRHFPHNEHLAAWGIRLLGLLCQNSAEHEEYVIRQGGLDLLMDAAQNFTSVEIVMESAVQALHILAQSARATAVVIEHGAVAVLRSALELFALHEALIITVFQTVEAMSQHGSTYAPLFVMGGMERAIHAATCCFPTTVEVISPAVQCCHALHLDPLESFKHNQLVKEVIETLQSHDT